MSSQAHDDMEREVNLMKKLSQSFGKKKDNLVKRVKKKAKRV